MRIAYLLYEDVFQPSGVIKKVNSQVRTWTEMGHDVIVFAVSPLHNVDSLAIAIETRVEVYSYNTWSLKNAVSVMRERIVDFYSLTNRIIRWEPHIVYFRQSRYYPAWEHLMRKIPTIIEVNTDDVYEGKLRYSNFRYRYNMFMRKRLFQHAAGLVFVTEELSNRQHFKIFNKPKIVIGNGIELNCFPLTPPPRNQQPQLTFMGSEGMPWHGIDKIEVMAELLPMFNFNIIGTTGISNRSNLKYHGFLTGDKYLSILAKTDIGIGTLALHRVRMNEATPLKVREYLAVGLPVIIGYHDTDLSDNMEFILEIPNCERNVIKNIELIKNFVYDMHGFRVDREKIKFLDYKFKENLRLEFFERILKNMRYIK